MWHLTRVQDHHVAELLGRGADLGHRNRGRPASGSTPIPTTRATGTRRPTSATVRPDGPDALIGYYDAVAARTSAFLATLSPADLDRIVDERWDPPVTLGVRLVSIADDDIQHAGQAAYVRGLLAPD